MPDLFAPIDKVSTCLLTRYFDVILTIVIETRAYFAAGEALSSDLEHWLWRKQSQIL